MATPFVFVWGGVRKKRTHPYMEIEVPVNCLDWLRGFPFNPSHEPRVADKWYPQSAQLTAFPWSTRLPEYTGMNLKRLVGGLFLGHVCKNIISTLGMGLRKPDCFLQTSKNEKTKKQKNRKRQRKNKKHDPRTETTWVCRSKWPGCSMCGLSKNSASTNGTREGKNKQLKMGRLGQ